ncbi:uncharacterized protein LOC128952350 [Oppia nitens]|uniref:uncharacterized protein LOC128952350 n=1 Tax=Oppia nitens TaxID=1686743 RepID=UPI0023DA3DA7|nr:uncharacterized protein LOC128952350 [Oppia nitens]
MTTTMSLNLILCLHLNAIVLAFIALIASIEAKVINCSIGVLGDCPSDEICEEWHNSTTGGHCVSHNNTIIIVTTTVKPLPIYSNDNNNSHSVIIFSIFGAVMSVMIVFMAYYFGFRKGMFRDVWRRAFTPHVIEHQLLDRSPQTDDRNDTEAIA